ncbi:hypothetical protein [Lignipirellula cremea]|uniref:Uncharacterized protein n=1 Tax=Lignipirellula cremea TaxID=2528010 RepID=A0A518DY64_9BACT|nr:hypothetical protein [Lignipirellula cremea]QDU96786.1 hypothetical protein Pla8534_46070 [Lignipirellula cremea]
MRSPLIFAILGVALFAPAVRADNLLSDFSIDEVYEAPPAQPQPQQNSQVRPGLAPSSLSGPELAPKQNPQALEDLPALARLLDGLGLEPQELENVVALKMPSAAGDLPVLISFTAGKEQLRMVLLLATYDEQETPPSDRLLQLLDANRTAQGACFAFNVAQRRTEMHGLLRNELVTARLLKGELDRLVIIAESVKSLWAKTPSNPLASGKPAVASPGKPTAGPTSSNTLASQSRPAPPASSARPAPGNSTTPGTAARPAVVPTATSAVPAAMIGQWVAARSKTEAFALRIDQNGSFAMVIVIGGKTIKSTGTYTTSGGNLNLTDTTGAKFAGAVKLQSKDQFELVLNEKTTLTFKRAS